ncbi:TPA: gamma-glutamyl-gamma-aminobutyrate hydrolase family protein [Legionella anisa]
MPKVAITYSPEVGGASVISLIKSFSSVDCEVIYADYREMMREIPTAEFYEAYKTYEGCQKLFAHAKKAAERILENVDCLALSGNTAMIDPNLFNQPRTEGQKYDFSRTIIELALTHVAIQKGMPIMGVFGGHQVIAVYGGGNITDLEPKKLDHHRYMNYDVVTFNADSTLKQFIEPKPHSNTSLKQEFFGAHFQAVEKLGEGFISAAKGSDGHIIEVAESEYGCPIITTQFHPEDSVSWLCYSYRVFF